MAAGCDSQLRTDFYRLELNRTVWDVPKRYKDLYPIGTGAYGQVCAALDVDTGKNVAIKKLARPFQTPIHAKRTYRELRLLHHMKHENVINLLDVFTPHKSLETFRDVYFVSDLMGADLNSVNKAQKLTDEHVMFLVYQILRGLKYIHSAGVIHRDLKPSNLAVNEDCELRILDFGLARQSDDEMTGYVATRWYRAPEIMLNWMHYTEKVDIWSVGCIMAELLTSNVLFPGSDNIDQLTKILTLTGTPDEAFLAEIESDNAREYVRSMKYYERKDFRKFFNGANDLAIDILEKMLDLRIQNRPTAAEALAHPYFGKFHDPQDEPEAEKFDDSFEKTDQDIEQWRVLVFELICAINQVQRSVSVV